MRFDYNKAFIQKIAKEQKYTVNNVEKVIRLSMILHDLNTLPEFKGKLLLKGGTGINLVAFEKLPRLSVDLDLDFAANISKEEMIKEREAINLSLKQYFSDNGYKMEPRSSFSLDSFALHYPTVTGGNDKIKLDINYHNRCHILDGQLSEIPFPFSITDIPLPVAHVATTELFAGKIKAFYERCKPRDIYDVFSLATSGILSSEEERRLMRKCIVFYSTLGNSENPDMLKKDIGKILDMPFQDIKTQLLPMLHIQSGKYPKDEINRAVIEYLTGLVQLDDSDIEYITEFYKGNYRPELLFPSDIAQKLSNHPVALRTQQMIRKELEKQTPLQNSDKPVH